MLSRRDFLRSAGLAAAAVAAAPALRAQTAESFPFRLRYVLSSAMYGYAPLAEVLPEVAKTGSESLDIWCKVHGDQREQAAALGDVAFAALLKQHGVKVGVSTRYPLGPLKLQDEMAWVKQHGGTAERCDGRAAAVPPHGLCTACGAVHSETAAWRRPVAWPKMTLTLGLSAMNTVWSRSTSRRVTVRG